MPSGSRGGLARVIDWIAPTVTSVSAPGRSASPTRYSNLRVVTSTCESREVIAFEPNFGSAEVAAEVLDRVYRCWQ